MAENEFDKAYSEYLAEREEQASSVQNRVNAVEPLLASIAKLNAVSRKSSGKFDIDKWYEEQSRIVGELFPNLDDKITGIGIPIPTGSRSGELQLFCRPGLTIQEVLLSEERYSILSVDRQMAIVTNRKPRSF